MEYLKAGLMMTDMSVDRLRLKLIQMLTEFKADRHDLCYFNIKIQDKEGRVVTSAEHRLSCIVQKGELLGIFSGNSVNDDKYTSNTCHAYKGCAVAIVRTNNPGIVKINVYSENLASGYAQVEAK